MEVFAGHARLSCWELRSLHGHDPTDHVAVFKETSVFSPRAVLLPEVVLALRVQALTTINLFRNVQVCVD